jgi:hypothetical protein
MLVGPLRMSNLSLLRAQCWEKWVMMISASTLTFYDRMACCGKESICLRAVCGLIADALRKFDVAGFEYGLVFVGCSDKQGKQIT